MLTIIASLLLGVPPCAPADTFRRDLTTMNARTGSVTKTQTTRTWTTRAPVGHTHTCAAGHTWDHVANPTHTCQFCGRQQWVQDRSPRPVTVLQSLASSTSQHPVQRVVPQSIRSNCPNGNCPLIRSPFQ